MIADVTASRAAPRRADRVFFLCMSLAVAAAVFGGFARTYFLRPRFFPQPLPLYLAIHGLVFSAWILLFVVQSALVAARRIDFHRTLGWAGAALAAPMPIVALRAAVLSGHRNFVAGQATAALQFFAVPVFAMVVFVPLVAAAVYYRRRPETHKRLMLLATISIIDAAVARWPLAVVSTTSWMYYIFTDLFIVAAMGYDLGSRKRIAPVYVWGGLFVIGGQALRELIGPTAAWQSFARMFVG